MTKLSKKQLYITGIVGAIIAIGVLAYPEQTVSAPEHLNGDGCFSIGGGVHFDKIVFQILKDPNRIVPDNLLRTELDIKVPDDPSAVSDIKQKVRDFLTSDGTTVPIDPPGAPTFFPEMTADEVSKLKIDIIDVEYEITSGGFIGCNAVG